MSIALRFGNVGNAGTLSNRWRIAPAILGWEYIKYQPEHCLSGIMQPGQNARVEDIIEWAKANMFDYKVPAYIEFKDSLPTLGTGKLLRRALKE